MQRDHPLPSKDIHHLRLPKPKASRQMPGLQDITRQQLQSPRLQRRMPQAPTKRQASSSLKYRPRNPPRRPHPLLTHDPRLFRSKPEIRTNLRTRIPRLRRRRQRETTKIQTNAGPAPRVPACFGRRFWPRLRVSRPGTAPPRRRLQNASLCLRAHENARSVR